MERAATSSQPVAALLSRCSAQKCQRHVRVSCCTTESSVVTRSGVNSAACRHWHLQLQGGMLEPVCASSASMHLLSKTKWNIEVTVTDCVPCRQQTVKRQRASFLALCGIAVSPSADAMSRCPFAYTKCHCVRQAQLLCVEQQWCFS